MRLYLSSIISLVALTATAQQEKNGYPISPVPFTQVKVEQNSFWGQRLEASRNVTIPLAFSKCEETGRYTNFSNAAKHLADTSQTFKVGGYSFDDTDPYKTIEGASYLLQTYPDKHLVAYIDSVLNIIASAQEKDGYLYTSRTQNPSHPHEWAGAERWSMEEDLSHELYNLGHMVEAAIAHYQATGSRKFIDIAIRYADCVCREVGPQQGQSCVVPGHQIAEIALAKLYLITGNKKYIDEAKFFLDYRGTTTIQHEYSQAHKPVVQQDEAVGHAVRAAYMYAGMADVAALTADTSYINAIDRIWDNIVSKKMYITGGIGSTSSGEAFGNNYELPNMSAYCETCAAIGNVYVNYRLFLLHGLSKYYDVLERTLYNGLISGVSLDGGSFFYPNPLASIGQHQRQPWFGCACCPSNICRFIPSLPGYVYAVREQSVYVNLFLSNRGEVVVGGKKVALTQHTQYPWNGDVDINIDKNTARRFDLKIRIPGWVRGNVVPSDLYRYTDNKRLNYSVSVNGKNIGTLTSDGYFTISREWKNGDKIHIHFDMEARTVRANNKVEADCGMISIERGPIVYCAEHPDNNFDIMSILINQQPQFSLNTTKVANTEVVSLITDAQSLSFDEKGRLSATNQRLTLIPYYAWCHRGSGAMRVWISQDMNATTPAMPPSLASKSVVSTSSKMPAITAINDRLIPRNEDDRSVPYTHWWPKQGTTEWIVYTLPEPTEVKSSTVYWFDDAPWGGCRVPKSWCIYYMNDNGEWKKVNNPDYYNVDKGIANTVNFDPIRTTAVKLEVQQPDEYSSGLFEWEVK